MKRLMIILAVVGLLISGFAPAALAAQQNLPELGYKFYPLRDMVFVDFYNANFTPVDNIVVNLVIREGTGRNRVVAIGQTKLPTNLVLAPGEHASAQVPIRARVVRDIPNLATFEFRINGRQLDENATPPGIVVQDSGNGAVLEFNRDTDGVPMVFGFIGIDPNVTADTNMTVQSGILTFYDSEHKVVWSETMPINGKLKNNESLMIWGKYQQISKAMVPDISSVDIKFVTSTGNQH